MRKHHKIVSKMKKKFQLLGIAVLVLTAVIFTACEEEREVIGIRLNKTSLTLTVGESYAFLVDVNPYDASFTLTSSDNTVATVSNNKVTAVGPGTATITARAGKKTATCEITVPGYYDEGVVINGVKWATRN
jgi:uncharacterized protein YjdB